MSAKKSIFLQYSSLFSIPRTKNEFFLRYLCLFCTHQTKMGIFYEISLSLVPRNARKTLFLAPIGQSALKMRRIAERGAACLRFSENRRIVERVAGRGRIAGARCGSTMRFRVSDGFLVSSDPPPLLKCKL